MIPDPDTPDDERKKKKKKMRKMMLGCVDVPSSSDDSKETVSKKKKKKTKDAKEASIRVATPAEKKEKKKKKNRLKRLMERNDKTEKRKKKDRLDQKLAEVGPKGKEARQRNESVGAENSFCVWEIEDDKPSTSTEPTKAVTEKRKKRKSVGDVKSAKKRRKTEEASENSVYYADRSGEDPVGDEKKKKKKKKSKKDNEIAKENGIDVRHESSAVDPSVLCTSQESVDSTDVSCLMSFTGGDVQPPARPVIDSHAKTKKKKKKKAPPVPTEAKESVESPGPTPVPAERKKKKRAAIDVGKAADSVATKTSTALSEKKAPPQQLDPRSSVMNELKEKLKKKKKKSLDSDGTPVVIERRPSVLAPAAASTPLGKASLGQWANVELSSTEKTNKFFRLLGGLKNQSGSPLSFRDNKGSVSSVGNDPVGDKGILALGKKDAETLNHKLEEQFKKAMGGLGKGKVGLGFSPIADQLDPSKKKFHIDTSITKSVKL